MSNTVDVGTLEEAKKYVSQFCDMFPFDREADYEAWKDARFDFIGSSTVAAICGLNKYDTPLQTWEKYINRKSTFTENDYTYMGHVMEEEIQKLVERQHDLKIVPYNVSHISKEFPFASATPDGIVYAPHRNTPGNNEVKFTSARADLDVWQSGQVPSWVLCQAQWQMGVCGLTWGTIDAMVQGNVNIHHHEIDFDPEFFEWMINRSKLFLKQVADKTPPRLDGSEDDHKVLDRLLEVNKEESSPLVSALASLPKKYLDLKGKLAEANKLVESLKKEKRAYDRQLKDTCEGAGIIKYSGGQFKLSKVSVSERVTGAFSYVRITHKKDK